MNWTIKLRLLSGDRSIFMAVLASANLSCTVRGDVDLVRGPVFNDMAAASDVNAYGNSLAAHLNALGHWDPTLSLDVQVVGVIGLDALGNELEHHVLLTGVGAICSVGAVATLTTCETPANKAAREAEEKRLEQERRERLAIAHVVPALQSDTAATVERLMRMEQSPSTLYNILEVIQKDQTVPISALSSPAQWGRCKQSMCHPAVVGDQARHVASTDEFPSKPIRLREAQEFVAGVATKWLEKKAGLPD